MYLMSSVYVSHRHTNRQSPQDAGQHKTEEQQHQQQQTKAEQVLQAPAVSQSTLDASTIKRQQQQHQQQQQQAAKQQPQANQSESRHCQMNTGEANRQTQQPHQQPLDQGFARPASSISRPMSAKKAPPRINSPTSRQGAGIGLSLSWQIMLPLPKHNVWACIALDQIAAWPRPATADAPAASAAATASNVQHGKACPVGNCANCHLPPPYLQCPVAACS